MGYNPFSDFPTHGVLLPRLHCRCASVERWSIPLIVPLHDLHGGRKVARMLSDIEYLWSISWDALVLEFLQR